MRWLCPYCSFEENLLNSYYWRCPRCYKPLDIKYHSTKTLNYSHRRNIWEKYAEILPFTPGTTRGEGSTPLIVENDGSNTVLFKLEYLNPSGSFKDRGSALAIYYGYRMRFKKVIEDSSGNTGISVTLYSKLYGLKPLIVMPRNAPEGKKKAILQMGGEIVEANNRDEASKMIQVFLEKETNIYYVAHLWSPFYILGASTIAYEVIEEFGAPDYVILPIGSGGLLLGIAHGFERAVKMGIINKLPKIIGVQGYSVQPVHEAYKGFHLPGESSDLADGLMVSNPPRLAEIVKALKTFKGDILLVGNSEIRKATIDLWEQGFLVEPTSAVTYAVYKKIRDDLRGSSILIILTGSGLKTL
ncbi:MAG: pyridoxal-phosphate dependent enzyme [Desulfurococcaceae archaeon]